MPLAIDVELLTGTYEAGIGGDRPEWPPHPARLFCALVAQVATEAERDALRWLERQGPPEVLLPDAGESVLRGFVPTNAIARAGGGAYLARTNGSRAWPRAHPSTPGFRLTWAGASPDADVLERICSIAGRVSYLGRPPGFVIVRVSRELRPSAEGLRRLVPASEGPYLLRVPYPGYLDALVAAFEAGEPAEAVSRSRPYAEPAGAAPPAGVVRPGPYARLFTLGFPPGAGIAGWHAMRVARAFRDAVLSRLGAPAAGDPWTPFPPADLVAIHGHGEGIAPEARCAFLALPFVGYPHATGELVGVGIAIGRGVAPGLRRALLQLLGLDRDDGPRLTELRIPEPGVTLPLAAPDGRRSLEPARWRRAARRWASALPVVLDRWPKRWADVPSIVAEGVRLAGYPEPAEVEVRRGSTAAGAPLLRPGDRKRRPTEPDRPWAHVVVSFPEPVEGPVLLGHLRFAGLGLCVPVGDDG
ncbi:MAG TPA: type I-U CRISPR-associated protein Csb2 [Actinomycetota bacterium]|nr:type I-U CRISPR-associated protein Csb2 [Actinomycetota bacterium]